MDLGQVVAEAEGRVEAVEGGPEGVRAGVVQQPAQLGQVLPFVGVHQVLGGRACPARVHGGSRQVGWGGVGWGGVGWGGVGWGLSECEGHDESAKQKRERVSRVFSAIREETADLKSRVPSLFQGLG